ncbi:hypothetical protein FDG2_3386 [Candidatus Protofrankia californiensis]|uniref:Uncharacterized protein n=1 Tax=Candidatus Protofrankia californiensis TaxID=1839754 RepID=A0A1C3NZJ0_9ACTN|nr:hypothetical protein FDG2_3386 [Candidatus Protofrankia californiensis]
MVGIDELARSDETFRPPGLVSLVRWLLSEGAPPEPITIEGQACLKSGGV